VINSYPVRKIVIEFQEGQIFANGRKYRDLDELVEWIKDCEKVHKNIFVGAINF